MNNKFLKVVVTASLSLLAGSVLACGPLPANALSSLAQKAVSEDAAVSAPAIRTLRESGPKGLDALFEIHAALIQKHDKEADKAAWTRLQTALDSVSGQHDCYASHLYWYTDLEQAKVAAKSTGKPILSLRLLGRLDEEYSCANSRFFRTTLYPNAEVSAYMRDHFILHWKSVRPIPRITVDFGDGRKIERTVTGNSIHYILDSDGQPVDALPGLYGAKAFLKGLADAERAALDYAKLGGDAKNQYLREYHRGRSLAIQTAWNKDITALGYPASYNPYSNSSVSTIFPSPTALAAGRASISKSGVETPMLMSFQDADDAAWAALARLHAQEVSLDAGTQELIRSKVPTAEEASRTAFSKNVVESPMVVTIRNLQRSIAEDTVRNEYRFHSQIHDWFVSGKAPKDLDQLNAKVYAELFLTPDSDPWLGLVPAYTFTALPNEGLVQAGYVH
ncbi:MAG: hypothetical protein JWR26_451 [Pedosphaera sp.]|nr:hypothetical protein [Pedosphaera sp.]